MLVIEFLDMSQSCLFSLWRWLLKLPLSDHCWLLDEVFLSPGVLQQVHENPTKIVPFERKDYDYKTSLKETPNSQVRSYANCYLYPILSLQPAFDTIYASTTIPHDCPLNAPFSDYLGCSRRGRFQHCTRHLHQWHTQLAPLGREQKWHHDAFPRHSMYDLFT